MFISDPNIEFKVLGEDGWCINGGKGKWSLPTGDVAGEWMPSIPNPYPCARGYHLCKGLNGLLDWIGPSIYVAEGMNAYKPLILLQPSVSLDTKAVYGSARLLRKIEGWNRRHLLSFVGKSLSLIIGNHSDFITPVVRAYFRSVMQSFYTGDEMPAATRKWIEDMRDKNDFRYMERLLDLGVCCFLAATITEDDKTLSSHCRRALDTTRLEDYQEYDYRARQLVTLQLKLEFLERQHNAG